MSIILRKLPCDFIWYILRQIKIILPSPAVMQFSVIKLSLSSYFSLSSEEIANMWDRRDCSSELLDISDEGAQHFGEFNRLWKWCRGTVWCLHRNWWKWVDCTHLCCWNICLTHLYEEKFVIHCEVVIKPLHLFCSAHTSNYSRKLYNWWANNTKSIKRT